MKRELDILICPGAQRSKDQCSRYCEMNKRGMFLRNCCAASVGV